MFQFTHGLLPGLCVQPGVSRHDSGGVAPFGYSGLIACMQLPLNVSPVSASFIGLMRLGILLVLLLACDPRIKPEDQTSKKSSPLLFTSFFSYALGKIEVYNHYAVVQVRLSREFPQQLKSGKPPEPASMRGLLNLLVCLCSSLLGACAQTLLLREVLRPTWDRGSV